MKWFIYRGNEKSSTELLPYQVELIWKNRDAYPYRFRISNAL